MSLAAGMARKALLPGLHEEVSGQGAGAPELPGNKEVRDLPPEGTRREMVHEQESGTLSLFGPRPTAAQPNPGGKEIP